MIHGHYSKHGYEVWQNDEIIYESEFAAACRQIDLAFDDARDLCSEKAQAMAVKLDDVYGGVEED